MARSSTSKEASILAYFQATPLPVANIVFNLVRGTTLTRNKATQVSPTKKKVTRRTRAKKVASSPAPILPTAPTVE